MRRHTASSSDKSASGFSTELTWIASIFPALHHMQFSMFPAAPLLLLLTVLYPHEVHERSGDQNVPDFLFLRKCTGWDFKTFMISPNWIAQNTDEFLTLPYLMNLFSPYEWMFLFHSHAPSKSGARNNQCNNWRWEPRVDAASNQFGVMSWLRFRGSNMEYFINIITATEEHQLATPAMSQGWSPTSDHNSSTTVQLEQGDGSKRVLGVVLISWQTIFRFQRF